MKTPSSLGHIYPKVQHRYRMLPFFGGIIEGFTSWCLDRGFSQAKVRGHVAGLRRLVPWFLGKHKQTPEDLSVDDIADAQHFYSNRTPLLARGVLALGEFLQVNGYLKQSQALRRIKRREYWRYRELPVFGTMVDDYVGWHVHRGFSVYTISEHLDILRRLVPWFIRRRKQSIDDITADDLAAVTRFYRKRKPWFGGAIGVLSDFLKTQGRLKPGRPVPLIKFEAEIARFVVHLSKNHGLARSTINRHCLCVRRLFKFLRIDKRRADLDKLKLNDLHRFICKMSLHYSRRTMPGVVGTLRRFLGFQFMQGALRQPLHLQLDSVQIYREERLPHCLPWSKVQKLLRSMDRSTPVGARDFVMLLLAASYGLRRSEVAALTLDDINWRARTLQINQIKTRQRLLLPLTDEVASTLIGYLRDKQPNSNDRHLFLRQKAPAGPLGAKGVAKSLRRAIRATGVKIETTSFHALRHAFALRLLREGTALKDIREVLGHRTINSTSEYLRLDTEDLRQVALPVPKLGKSTSVGRSCNPRSADDCVSSGRKFRTYRYLPISKAKGFSSFLAKPIRDFLALHRALGRDYQVQEWILRNVDCFLVKRHPNGRIFTAGMFEGWVAEQAVVSPTVRSHWMGLLRKLCLYLVSFEPKTFIPDSRTFPKQHYQAPCLLSRTEVARLLAAATQKPRPLRGPEHPLRPHTMRLAVLMLYCCGLRHGELLKLRLADIDTEEQTLRINQTKFHKSRLVPLSPSVSKELRKYLQKRRRYKTPMEPSAPLFWSGRQNRIGGAFSKTGLRSNWYQICYFAGVLNHRGRPPRIHDLRHSFAVAVLQRAYETRRDPQATLPRLSRYMGHVGFQSTHYYLKLTEPLRLAANDRFRRFLDTTLIPTAHYGLRKGGAQ
jgi:integrase/recombinase XerD